MPYIPSARVITNLYPKGTATIAIALHCLPHVHPLGATLYYCSIMIILLSVYVVAFFTSVPI